jgi:exosortase
MDVTGGAVSQRRPGTGLGAWDWLALALLSAAFVPGLLALERTWASVEYYSHGYFVPAVAALCAWREREALRETPAVRSLAGLGLLVVALALYGFGAAAGLVEVQGVGIVAAVAAAVLWLRGPAWLRVLAFPIAYLIFMIPLPDAMLQPLILRLRLFVTTAAVSLLHAGGIPVLREGNVIALPGGDSLFVADACSGVTSLVTLTPLAVLVAQLTERARWRRVLLVLSVVPIALVFNLVRVLGTVLAAERVGAEAATSGALHEAAGLLTYIVGCVALLGVGSLLRRVRPST